MGLNQEWWGATSVSAEHAETVSTSVIGNTNIYSRERSIALGLPILATSDLIVVPDYLSTVGKGVDKYRTKVRPSLGANRRL
jgi:hypothetical protein